MKKLLVFVSVAIFAIAGCQEEAKTTDDPNALIEQAAVVIEDVPAKQEVAEEVPELAQPEEVVVQPETPAVAEEVVEEIDLDAVVVTVNGQEITEKEVSDEVAKMV
ncbi:MAG: hypothetical protein DRP56_03960, partial [Planctomycetota bacterium]